MSILDTAKDIYELVKKSATIELKERLIQLREEAIALQEENLTLNARINELEEALAIEASLEWDGRVYWRLLPDENREGPYCQRCYDVDRKLVRLHSHHTQIPGQGGLHRWECKSCEKVFYDNRR